jgi:hypothetical protein
MVMAEKLPDVVPAGEEPKKHGDKLEQEVRQEQHEPPDENTGSLKRSAKGGKQKSAQQPAPAQKARG